MTIIGGGPSGLMAADILSKAGVAVSLYDRMPNMGRKFLMAGRGGLNLTYSEPLDVFLGRYGAAERYLRPAVECFPPAAAQSWSAGLGQPTFVGSSGRVFPKSLKASPLLRAWLVRLQRQGVRFHPRHAWRGWNAEDRLLFHTADGGEERTQAAATLLALGGASWPRLGSDGSWTEILSARGIAVTALRPANCGFRVAWSDIFRAKFEGRPLKTLALTFGGITVRGEAMVTASGIEGGAVYALSARLRDAIAASGPASLHIDLCPGRTHAELAALLAAPRRAQSQSSFLRRTLNLPPIAISLLHEGRGSILPAEPGVLAGLIKAAPIVLTAPLPIDRAISTAGGLDFAELDGNFMLRRLPGTFAAGEMLDWEAPTGGYLLQGAFATGAAAARGILAWLGAQGAIIS